MTTENETPASAGHRQAALDKAADTIFLAVAAAGKIKRAVSAGNIEEVKRLATDAVNLGTEAQNILVAPPIGAANPWRVRAQVVKEPKTDPFDLSALATMDTPDTRELLRLLERAQEVAERVDASRGRALPLDVPLSPGESRGTDLAESLSLLALRVRGEVGGAKGKD